MMDEMIHDRKREMETNRETLSVIIFPSSLKQRDQQYLGRWSHFPTVQSKDTPGQCRTQPLRTHNTVWEGD